MREREILGQRFDAMYWQSRQLATLKAMVSIVDTWIEKCVACCCCCCCLLACCLLAAFACLQLQLRASPRRQGSAASRSRISAPPRRE